MGQKAQIGSGLHKWDMLSVLPVKVVQRQQWWHAWACSPKSSGHRICPADTAAIPRMCPRTSESQLNARALAITAMVQEGRRGPVPLETLPVTSTKHSDLHFLNQNTWPHLALMNVGKQSFVLATKRLEKKLRKGEGGTEEQLGFLLHIIITS